MWLNVGLIQPLDMIIRPAEADSGATAVVPSFGPSVRNEDREFSMNQKPAAPPFTPKFPRHEI
jgi:hypothetical protein